MADNTVFKGLELDDLIPIKASSTNSHIGANFVYITDWTTDLQLKFNRAPLVDFVHTEDFATVGGTQDVNPWTPTSGTNLITIRSLVQARRVSNSNVYSWVLTSSFKLISGTLTLVGSTTLDHSAKDAAELNDPAHVVTSGSIAVRMSDPGPAAIAFDLQVQHFFIKEYVI